MKQIIPLLALLPLCGCQNTKHACPADPHMETATVSISQVVDRELQTDKQDKEDAIYKELSQSLQKRDASADAKVFHDKGGFGMIMGYGGLLSPIGSFEGKNELYLVAVNEFVVLNKYDPELFAILNPLLEDPCGSPFRSYDIEKKPKLSESRKKYQDARTKYADEFNQAMILLRHGPAEDANDV